MYVQEERTRSEDIKRERAAAHFDGGCFSLGRSLFQSCKPFGKVVSSSIEPRRKESHRVFVLRATTNRLPVPSTNSS